MYMYIHPFRSTCTCISLQYIVATISQLYSGVCLCPDPELVPDRELVPNSAVLVRLHMIRFSCSEKASEGENLVMVLVSQLKEKRLLKHLSIS